MKLSIDSTTLHLLNTVSEFFTRYGVRAYLTGGFVRDVLLEREMVDIDITLTADALKIAPELATALGGKYVLLDEVNGVGRIVLTNGEPGKTREQPGIDRTLPGEDR